MAIKARSDKAVEQPQPFTPGVTRAMIRQHAYEMFRDRRWEQLSYGVVEQCSTAVSHHSITPKIRYSVPATSL